MNTATCTCKGSSVSLNSFSTKPNKDCLVEKLSKNLKMANKNLKIVSNVVELTNHCYMCWRDNNLHLLYESLYI